MKQMLKKYLLPISSIATIVIPTTFIISCGTLSPTIIKKANFNYQELDLDANIKVAFAQINKQWLWTNRDKIFSGWLSIFSNSVDEVIPIKSFDLKLITVHAFLNKYVNSDGIIQNEHIPFKFVISGFNKN